MSYTDYNPATPDPTTQTPGQAFTSDRANLLAMRDAIISGVGFFPGWTIELQNGDGSTPPTDPSQPAQIVYANGVERVKLAITWGSGRVTRLVTSYSANSGSNYDVIKGGSTNGYFNLNYDANGLFLSGTWS